MVSRELSLVEEPLTILTNQILASEECQVQVLQSLGHHILFLTSTSALSKVEVCSLFSGFRFP